MKKALAIIIALILLVGLVGCGGVKFEVNFIVDGEVYSTVGTGGEEIIKMPENPTKEGYTFGGWYWDKDSWKKPFTANSLLDAPLSSDMSVYAKWDAEERGIRFNTLAVEGNNVSGVVSNDTDSFSFVDEIVRNGGAEYVVSFDRAGTKPIPTKTIDLVCGDNSVYITEYVNGDPVTVYTVIIRRKPAYTVSFKNHDGTTVDEQVIEEGSLAEASDAKPSRPGYDFDGWDYDFSKVIMGDTVINAVWTARDDTKYTVEYYLENLSKNGYDKVETLSLKGVTDTEAVAEQKTFAHFTFNEDMSTVSGNIDGEGNLVLRVYYTRDTYKVSTSVNISGSGSVTSGGTYAYGKQIGLTASAPNAGYTFLGIFVDGERVTESNTYTITVEKAVSVEARFEVKAEMSNFEFTSTTTTCEITGIKNKTVKNIVVPDYVTSIGKGAFSGCSSLESITLPFVGGSKKSASNTYQYPFGYIFGTSSYEGGVSTRQDYYGWSTSSTTYDYYYIPSSLKTVTITGGNILRGAFYNCSRLTSVTIGSGVTSIGYSAFDNCKGLTSITIPNSVRTIGYMAFRYCTGLTSVTIPNSVTSIGDSAFSVCYKLVEVINKSDLNITAGSEDHGRVAYYAKEVHEGDSKIVNLNDYLFYTYNGVNYLLGYAGDDTTLVLPENYKGQNYEIYEYAFSYCKGLTSVTIPDSVTSIGSDAFRNCTSLTSISVDAGNTAYKSIDGNLYTKDGKTLIQYAIGKTDKHFAIPDGVTSIGDEAFRNCTGLTSVTIGSGVESIGSFAFSYCTGLTSVTILNSVRSIGSDAFYGCYKLVEVINKSSLNITAGSSDYGYVAYCAKEVHKGESKIVNLNDYLFYTYNGVNYLLGYAGDDTTLVLPENYKGQNYEIYEYAFYNCTDFTSITIPNGVTSIGYSAFSHCSGLTSVTIPDSVTRIGYSAFEYCTGLTSINYRGTQEQWNAITKYRDWDSYTGSYTVNYNYTGE